MRRVPCIALALTLLAVSPTVGHAESFPPPTLQEILEAECIVVGRYVEEEGGTLRFAPESVIRGDADTVSRLARSASERFPFGREEGVPVLWTSAMAARFVNDRTRVDPRRLWLWFLTDGANPEVQPPELADGYRALLEKKEPSLLFRLLQGLDPDMEWAATEELAAEPDQEVVERLHQLALGDQRHVSYASRHILQWTGLADGSRVARIGESPQPAGDERWIPLDTLPPWTEEDEFQFLLDRLTSHWGPGFIIESAAREIVEHHFERGFAELRKRLRQDDVYNADMVMDGIGYLKHPEVFGFLQGYMSNVPVGHRTFGPGLVALARQDSERSFDALREILESRLGRQAETYRPDILRRAFALMSDPRAKAEIERLGGAEPKPDLAAMKAEVTRNWPRRTRNRWRDGRSSWGMQNFAGDAPRLGAVGEVARQDPAWFAGHALHHMDSDWRAARMAGERAFRQLTGRDFGYRGENLAKHRREPLEKLKAWWAENGEKSREEWLLSYFREKGFPMERLWSRDSLPILSRALESDFLTHRLAVEQISVITGKFFTWFTDNRSHADREKMTIRVRAWLDSRGY